MQSTKVSSILFIVLGAATLLPQVTTPMALVAGIAFALIFGNPYLTLTKKWTPILLQFCVVGMAGVIHLEVLAKVGLQGVGYTVIGIIFTMALGYILGRALKVPPDTSLLVSSGTAICGGSAIAAVSSTIGAKSTEISVALATVFLLNAAALIIFPSVGHALNLSQEQFGLWSALAIHDTSSVVGASMQYGPRALEIATTVKMARALWIIPLSAGIGFIRSRKNIEKNTATNTEKNPTDKKAGKIKKPWFILGFLIVAALVTWIPALEVPGRYLTQMARQGLVLTLFLIGSGITRATLRSVGLRPFILGLLLWIVVASLSLGAVVSGWAHFQS